MFVSIGSRASIPLPPLKQSLYIVADCCEVADLSQVMDVCEVTKEILGTARTSKKYILKSRMYVKSRMVVNSPKTLSESSHL